MNRMNKKTVGGIALAAILVAGMFTFIPSASADLTVLDKFGRITELLIEIKNLLLDPTFGLEEIKNEVRNIEEDLQLKKRFYQLVDETSHEVTDKIASLKVKVDSCEQKLIDADACAFNVESLIIEADISGDPISNFVDIRTVVVDGVQSTTPVVTLNSGREQTDYLVDTRLASIGASESVEIKLGVVGTATINKIEFNGEQPQGMELVIDFSTSTSELCFGIPAYIVGTGGDDILTGTAGDDVIVGLGGNDVIDGLGGNDLLCGGAGDDVMSGGAGNDSMSGGDDIDTMSGGDGDDSMFGNAGDDEMFGGAGNDFMVGDTGDDEMGGGDGDDVMGGDIGEDEMFGGAGDDSMSGGTGDDEMVGNEHNDDADGGADTDTCDAETETNCE